VQFIWSVFETDAENVTNRMAADSFYKLKYPISGDPVQKVRQVWEAFDIHCQNYTIAQIVLGKFKKHPSKYFLHFGLWYRVVSKAYLLRKTQSQLSI
jgi:ABC-type transporter MlaC component